MLNPTQMPGSIADSVEFVKKLWGIPSAGALPGMLIPTLSIDEINKKITDLKAVESWLTVNMNMLRGTIQALEVQSATIVNLQSMGAMLSAQQAEAKTAMANGASAFPFSFPGWPPAGADSAAAAGPTASSAATPSPSPFVSPFARHAETAAPAPAAPEAAPAAAAAPEPEPAPVDVAKPTSGAAAPNPNAWWDLLQNQFKQAVGTALLPDALKAASTRGAKPASDGDAPEKPAKAARAAAGTAAVRKTAAGGKIAKSVKSPAGATAKKSSAAGKG